MTALCPGGPAVGPVGFGLWRFAGHDLSEAERLIGTALDHGLTLMDNADVYGFGGPRGFGGAEVLLGEVLTRNPSFRDRMVLVTKGGVDLPTPYDATRDYLLKACDASLARMGVDAVDLYLVHRPDPLAHPAETGAALDEIVRSGRAARVGVSNYTPTQARALAAHMDARISVHQPELSAWAQDAIFDGTLDWCLETGAGVLAWSPLARGALATGEAPKGADEAAYARVLSVLDDLAARHDATRSQVALAFVSQHPAAPVPLIGTQRPERIAEAAESVSVRLSRADWFSLVEARRGPLP